MRHVRIHASTFNITVIYIPVCTVQYTNWTLIQCSTTGKCSYYNLTLSTLYSYYIFQSSLLYFNYGLLHIHSNATSNKKKSSGKKECREKFRIWQKLINNPVYWATNSSHLWVGKHLILTHSKKKLSPSEISQNVLLISILCCCPSIQ